MPDEEIGNEKVEDKDILKVLKLLQTKGDYESMLKTYCHLPDYLSGSEERIPKGWQDYRK